MRDRRFELDERSITLPKGTRVVLRCDVRDETGYVHRAASPAVVREVVYETYTLETPAGRQFLAQRDQLTVTKKGQLTDLGLSQWDFRRLHDHVIYSAVVGSQAWGLAGPDSDEDVRGCYLAPFEGSQGLWRVPDEIHDAGLEEAYWEVGKLVYQGLRGDANTLEVLWSPLHRVCTPLGERLLSERQMFVSMNVMGSFGRYAQSQFRNIERSVARDGLLQLLLQGIEAGRVTDEAQAILLIQREVPLSPGTSARAELKAVVRSLMDRGVIGQGGLLAVFEAVSEGRRAELQPPPHRPKNAYNLLRLLHSCVHWLRHGAPLIEVQGELRQTLLDIKAQRTPIEQTLRLAKEAAALMEATENEAKLPPAPDYDAAHQFLLDCRRAAARVSIQSLGVPASIPGPEAEASWFAPLRFVVPLPPDVDVGVLGRFFDLHLAKGPPVVALALSGAHAYGFISPDSDLDLKGVHVQGARALLGIEAKAASVDVLTVFEGREHDYTTNDLGTSMKLLLAGNGNLIERFLGPFPLIQTRAGLRLAELAQGSLSRRCYHHYRGFAKGVLREYAREKEAGTKKAKRLLYAYRVLLTGRHLLQAGELRTDVRVLSNLYDCEASVRELIAIKLEAEGAQVREDGAYLEQLGALERALDGAITQSSLPEDPSNAEAIDAFVVQLRLAAG